MKEAKEGVETRTGVGFVDGVQRPYYAAHKAYRQELVEIVFPHKSSSSNCLKRKEAGGKSGSENIGGCFGLLLSPSAVDEETKCLIMRTPRLRYLDLMTFTK